MKTKKSLISKIFKVLLVLFVLIFITFVIVAITSRSLGGALIFVPSVIFGVISVLFVFKWPMKKKISIFFVLLFALTGWFGFHVMYKFIQPTVWTKSVVSIGNPWVLQSNIFPNNNYNNPVVIKLSNGTFRMYFHDHQNNMLTAVSTDGQHFNDVTKIFNGMMPTVIKLSNGSYRMYYFVNSQNSLPNNPNQPQPGVPNQPPPAPCNGNCPAMKHDLVSATSTDGLHWTQDPGIRLAATPLNNDGYDASTMIHPSVIQMGNGTYKLYYDGEVDPTSTLALASHYRRILSASSKDGLHWSKDPSYRIDASMLHTYEAYSPKALYQNGKVILHFTTPNGIYQAESTDGMHFTIDKGPIFSPGRTPMPGPEGAPGSYQDAYVLPDPSAGINRIYFWINGKGIFYATQKI